MRKRGFEAVYNREDVKLPERSTKNSAGYDFYANEDVEIEPVMFIFLKKLLRRWDKSRQSDISAVFSLFGSDERESYKIQPTLVKTGVKAYMQEDEYLAIVSRSSSPKKLGLIVSNSLGVIDSDYYSNPENDGEIGVLFYNLFPWTVHIKKDDKLCQGIFMNFLKADDDNSSKERIGGFGSTGK